MQDRALSVSDGGGELIPPLGGQTGEELVLGPGGLERWDHQTVTPRLPSRLGVVVTPGCLSPGLQLDSIAYIGYFRK